MVNDHSKASTLYYGDSLFVTHTYTTYNKPIVIAFPSSSRKKQNFNCIMSYRVKARVWYLIGSIPDLCTLTYFKEMLTQRYQYLVHAPRVLMNV